MYNYEDTADSLLYELSQPGVENDVLLTRRLLKKVRITNERKFRDLDLSRFYHRSND